MSSCVYHLMLNSDHTSINTILTLFADACTEIYLSVLQDGFVTVRKSDLEKLSTEVMQLKEFLPRVLNGDLIQMLQKARTAQTGMLFQK